MAEEKYPEHIKLQAISEKSQACGEFLDWLNYEKGLVLAEFSSSSYTAELQASYHNVTDLLAEFFNIDQNKIEREKRQMLEELRVYHKEMDNWDNF